MRGQVEKGIKGQRKREETQENKMKLSFQNNTWCALGLMAYLTAG